MTTVNDSSRKVDVLIKEHEAICAQIREMVSYSDRILGFGITILGAVFLYGIKEAVHAITIATPFALSFLLLFCSSIFSAILSLGGYRRYLEDKLALQVGERVLMWEYITPRILHTSFATASISVASVALLLTSMYLGWRVSAGVLDDQTRDFLVSGYAVTFLLLLGSFLKLRRSHSDAHAAASGLEPVLPLVDIHSLLLSIPPIRALASRLSRLRGKDVANQILPLLGESSSVLDLGCGTCGVSLALKHEGFEVFAADVRDISLHPEVRVTLHDPYRLPFTDNQFDACVLHMTLHHAREPGLLLREAARVARRIIVGEELVNSALGKFLLTSYDKLANFSFVSEPHRNLPDPIWRRLFSENNLTVVSANYSTVFGFIKQALYVLEKQ